MSEEIQLSDEQIDVAAAGWACGLGTKELAGTIQVPEYAVYNKLKEIKALAAEQRGSATQ